MISPIVVVQTGHIWTAYCQSLSCELRHVAGTGRTCGEAEAAAMPHLRELAGPGRDERADVVTRLARHRREQGLSLRDVAETLGLAHSTVGQWERGDRVPSAPLVEAWAAALGYRLALVPHPAAHS